jgi:hypothetical protein
MYKDSASNLCFPCLSTCLSCNNTVCTTCIPGFILSNNYLCIPGALSSTGWVSKNVSYELTANNLAASDLAVWINTSSITNLNLQISNVSLQSTCSKLPLYTWLGGYSLFGYSTKIIKSSFGLSPHQWANIRFQAVLIDYWLSNTLLVEVDTIDSYNETIIDNTTTIAWSGTFNSSQRYVDFCGNSSIPDNIAIIDTWFAHNLSSLKFNIRLN